MKPCVRWLFIYEDLDAYDVIEIRAKDDGSY